MKVALFGTGLMGFNMARRLLEKNIPVVAWNRTIEKAKPLEEFGAEVTPSFQEALKKVDLVAIMVSDDEASGFVMENICFESRGNMMIINHSTVTPSHSKKMHEMAHRVGCKYVALPVMGGPGDALRGELVGIAGGDWNSLDAYREYVDALFRKIHVLRSVEEASAVKLALNSIYFSAMIGLAEALVLAESWGTNPQQLLDIAQDLWIKTIAERYGSRLLADNYPVSFKLRLAAKDMLYATIAGGERGVSLPHISTMAQTLLSASMREKIKEEDYTRIYKFLKGLV
ncbi:MAG: NAD(P)-dependent oxidoreductase [Infirmifilum sp.]